MSEQRPTIVVIGGGVAGLTAARAAARNADVVLLEASAELGGRVRTVAFAGELVDAGPEALVAYQPGLRERASELGVSDDLIEPVVSDARLYVRGALRAIPPKVMDGAPGGGWAIARSGVLSIRGMLRAGFDWIRPTTMLPSEPSISDVVAPRLGREVIEHLIEPMLGNIHAGSCDRLDAELLAPQLIAARREHRSLVQGLRTQAAKRPAPPSGAAPRSPFRTMRGGLVTLIRALEADALQAGVTVKTACAVTRIDRDHVVHLADGTDLSADAIVLAAPAPVAAQVLANVVDQHTRDAMNAIRWASTATILLHYGGEDVRDLPEISGVLIPQRSGVGLSAVTCSTMKWRGAEAARRGATLKCYLGHADDEQPVTDLPDDELVLRARRALAELLGITGAPLQSQVERFAHAIPQDEPGHRTRVAEIEASVTRELPRLQLAGASWHGSGIGTILGTAHEAGVRAAEIARAGDVDHSNEATQRDVRTVTIHQSTQGA